VRQQQPHSSPTSSKHGREEGRREESLLLALEFLATLLLPAYFRFILGVVLPLLLLLMSVFACSHYTALDCCKPHTDRV
jgi:hypothetical protein